MQASYCPLTRVFSDAGPWCSLDLAKRPQYLKPLTHRGVFKFLFPQCHISTSPEDALCPSWRLLQICLAEFDHRLESVMLVIHQLGSLPLLRCVTMAPRAHMPPGLAKKEGDLFLVVVGHLKPSPLEAALDVEALVGLAAVEDGLIGTNLLSNEVEGLDQAQAELLALLVLCDRDVLDVADKAEVVNAGGWRYVLARQLDLVM